MKVKGVTRIEVIGNGSENNRKLVEYDVCDVEILFQDDGRTMKIFFKKKPE